MPKKISIILLTSFFIFLFTLFFYNYKINKLKGYFNKVKNIESNLEKKELKEFNFISSFTGDENINVNKVLEEMIANNFSNSDDIIAYDSKNWKSVRYKKLYISSMNKKNSNLAIKSIKNLLKTTQHKDVWYKKLIDLYIKNGNFKMAEKFSKELLKIEGNKENLKKYFYIKFQNVNFSNKKNIDEINKLILLYYKKGIINDSDLVFYNFIIELVSNWKLKNFEKNINMVINDMKNESYKDILINIRNDYLLYKKHHGTQLYYFKSLVSLTLLKFGYFGLAKNIAENVYIEDSSYILAKQILGYSYFFIGDYKKSIKYFKELRFTGNNENELNFFIGMGYYWLNQPKNAILYLSQIESKSSFYKDVLRYKLISYIKINNMHNFIKNINEMLKFKLLHVDYYNIFKYLLYNCENCYKENPKLIINIIKKCYNEIKKDQQYVCWFGKANLFFNFGKKKLSIKYFEMLTEYFQDAYIYEILGNFYQEKGEIEKSINYLLKQLLYTEDENERVKIKERIKTLFINRKN